MVVACICAVGAILSSCNKTDNRKIVESGNPDETKRELMLNRSDYGDYSLADMQSYSISLQREIFRQMSPEKKASIWKDRIDLAISEEPTDEAKLKLAELKDLIISDIYQDEEPGDELIQPITGWVEGNMTIFGFDRMRQIMITLNPIGPAEAAAPGQPGGSLPDCECSFKKDFCMTGDDFVNTWCQKKTCDPSSWGCGWAWAMPCAGMCGK